MVRPGSEYGSMDDEFRRRLLKFAETPLVEHAVEVLRSIIPPGHENDKWRTDLLIQLNGDGSIRAGLSLAGTDHKAVQLNGEQRAAFEFLLATATYHRSLITQAWPNMERRSNKRPYAPDLPQYGGRAIGMVIDELELRLRVEIYAMSHPDTRAIKVSP